jgi:hypothetical protein
LKAASNYAMLYIGHGVLFGGELQHFWKENRMRISSQATLTGICLALWITASIHAADESNKGFAGTWGILTPGASSKVGEKYNGDGSVTETYERTLVAGDSGIVQINDDGTYLWHGFGRKVPGKWEKKGEAIVLKAIDGKDDWEATLAEGGKELRIKTANNTIKDGGRIVKDQSIVQKPKTDASFYEGTWNLTLNNVKQATLTINKDGTFAYDRFGTKSEGKFAVSTKEQVDGIEVKIPGDRDLTITQDWRDNSRLYVVTSLGTTWVGKKAK